MVEVSSILIFLVIVFFIITISFFITEPTYKLAYFLLVGLGFLCILNIYLSIFYYIKLRNDEGIPGPVGPKGVRGPAGEPGKCTYSESCGIEKPREKIVEVASKMYEIKKECLNNPTTNNCDNEDALSQAIQISKQINILEDMAKTTTMAEKDFLEKLEICLDNPEVCRF
jgi:hypothetical protein